MGRCSYVKRIKNDLWEFGVVDSDSREHIKAGVAASLADAQLFIGMGYETCYGSSSVQSSVPLSPSTVQSLLLGPQSSSGLGFTTTSSDDAKE